MVRVHQFWSLCPRRVHRHPPLLGHRISPTDDHVHFRRWTFRPTVIASRSTHNHSLNTSSLTSRHLPNLSNSAIPVPESGTKFDNDATTSRPSFGVRPSPRTVIPENFSELGEDMMNEAEAYEASELDCDNQEPSSLEAQRDILKQKYQDGLKRFLPEQLSPNKPDLSYTDVLAWESWESTETKETRLRRKDATLTFNSDSKLRRIMLAYLHEIEPILGASSYTTRPENHSTFLEEALSNVFCPSTLSILARRGYDVSDVACWAWIFTAPAVDLSISRYIILMDEFRSYSPPRQIPRFVVLQLLRSASIGQFPLKRLVETLLRQLQCCHEQQSYGEWRGWVTRVCLIVRLLRHARRTDPGLLHEIASIVRHLFSDIYSVSERAHEHLGLDGLDRLSHVYNRFLSLISLPSPREPFKWSLNQQNAQLALVRLMAGFQPQLPVTREGFRALIKVQLAHKKTAEERSWAEAKSLSWPPWRRDKLGIEEDLEYPGKESRAMKLLRRMTEAGYAHGPWEKAASVLSGWDTDKSPTIQTRSILGRAKIKLFPGSEESKTEDTTSSEVWTARIRSTRSKLEAWAAFSAYVKSTPLAQRQYLPYYAMLEELMAKTVEPQSVPGSTYLPGDVKETFTDPINPNQRVYVETQVPTSSDFYLLMLNDGFKPAGSLLCDLLDSATNLESGFRYIVQSKVNVVLRDVLLHAENYPHNVLKQKLRRLRPDFLAAFYCLLCRYGFESQTQLSAPGSHTGEAGNYTPAFNRPGIRPLQYARQLLQISDLKNITTWNGFLKGSAMCVANVHTLIVDGDLTVSAMLDIKMDVWRNVEEIFTSSNLQWLGLNPDLYTFRHMAWLVQSLVGEAYFYISSAQLVEFTKSIFVNAAYGKNNATWPEFGDAIPPLSVPQSRDIRNMVRLMIAAHDVKGLLEMIKWLNRYASTFKGTNSDFSDGFGNDHGDPAEIEISHFRGSLCAIRLFLEGSKGLYTDGSSSMNDELWFDTPLQAYESDIVYARTSCKQLRWPTDQEVQAFLAQNTKWVFKAAQAADFTSRKEELFRGRNNNFDQSADLQQLSDVEDGESPAQKESRVESDAVSREGVPITSTDETNSKP